MLRLSAFHLFVVRVGVLQELSQMDVTFVALATVFFALSWGLVVLCDKVRS